MNCQLTKQNLGDLDYNMFTYHNATLHYRTLKHDVQKPVMSSWFVKKDAEERCRLLQLSTRKGPTLRINHKEQERSISEKRKLMLIASKQKLKRY